MKILLADGNEITNLGLLTFLKNKYEVSVAKSSTEMDFFLSNSTFDIVLIDYASSNFSFLDLKKIKSKWKKVKIIAISSSQSSTVAKAIQSGVQSHLKKTCDFGEIIDCIESTFEGEHFICGEILEDFKKYSIDLTYLFANKKRDCAGVKISDREIEIIKLIAEGNSAKQIASQLFLSSHTIHTHRKNIFSKLRINSTSGLVIYAVKKGIVDVEQYQFEI